MTLEELDRAEAEARRLRSDPFVNWHANIRRSERRGVAEYAAANGMNESEALRALVRDGLLRWKQGGEHG